MYMCRKEMEKIYVLKWEFWWTLLLHWGKSYTENSGIENTLSENISNQICHLDCVLDLTIFFNYINRKAVLLYYNLWIL